MNKRFFTLMAAVLLAGAPFANETFAEERLAWSSITEEGIDVDDIALANGLRFALKDQDGDYVKVEKIGTTGLVQISTQRAAKIKDAAVFEIAGYANNTFQLKTADGQVVDNADDKNKLFYASNSQGLVKTAGFTAIKVLKVGNNGGDGDLITASADFMAISYDYNDLNANLSGKGFKLNFPGLVVQPDDNPFAEQMVAIPAEAIHSINNKVPLDQTGDYGLAQSGEDVFLVKANEAGLKLLKAANDYMTSGTAIDKAKFEEATFIVVNPNKNFGISALDADDGEGYDFTTVLGAKLAENNKKADGQIAFANGIFGIGEMDHYNAEDELDILVDPKVATADGENVQQLEPLFVGVYSLTAGGIKSYVTTKQDNYQLSKATTGGNTYAMSADVLKTAKEAAIYNIFFQGDATGKGSASSSYGKYYVAGNVASAPKNVNTKLANAQWVVTNVESKGFVTFANVYKSTETITLKLYKTATAGVYQVASGFDETEDFPTLGTEYIKLIPATEGSNFMALTDSQLARKATIVFNGSGAVTVSKIYPYIKKTPTTVGETTTTTYSIKATSDADDAAAWMLKKSDKITHELSFAYLKGNALASDKAKCEIQSYNLVDAKTGLAVETIDGALVAASSTNLVKCVFRLNANGTYTVIEAKAATADDEDKLEYADILNGNVLSVKTDVSATELPMLQFTVANDASKYNTVSVSVEELGESLPAVSRHATFEGIEGGISAAADAKGMIHAIVSSEPLTFWLDTAESKAETPKFYISFGIAGDDEEEVETKAAEEAEPRMFLYTPTDSIWTWDANKAENVENKNYYNAVKDLRAIYRPAALVAVDTIATLQGAKEVLVSKEAKTGVVAGLDRFQFAITKSGEDYVITNHAGNYLYNLNGVLGFTSDKNKAMLVTVGEGDPTANEAIEAASSIEVIGGQGVVTVQGAAGKVITVANILGQTIANQVAASDNVTIAAPAGIVVVSVDGDATKVIVK